MADPAGTTTTTQTKGLPAFAEPYAQYGLSEALAQYQAGAPEYYPGQTYVEFAPQTEQALLAAEQRALAGSPVMQAAQDLMQQTLTGGFLGGTPGLEAAIARATEPAQAAAMSSLASRGRLGSGLGGQAVAKTVGDIAAEMSYQDYLNERARQQQALTYAPTFAQADYYDISQLGQVGAAREAQAQKAITDAMARYQYETTAPQQQLGEFMKFVYGYPGQTGTTVTPYFEPSTGQQFLGGALIGSKIFKDQPLLGAGLGGLLGTLQELIMADTGLLGSLMGGAANIGRSILNIPSQIGEQYKAGSLFGSGGALGDLLGEQARKEAQDQAIMKLGLGLLGQGPSRTPISFGQSLASGLLGAQEEYQKGLQSQLAQAQTLASMQDAQRKLALGDLDTQLKLMEEQRKQAKEEREQQEFLMKQQEAKTKAEEAVTKTERKEAQAISGGIMAIDAIDKALNVIDTSPTATGLSGQLLRGIEVSPAGQLDSYYDTIRSKLGFTELQAMRENSPTGGALGQVSDRENQLLQSTIASLRTGLSAETQTENLNKIKDHLAGIVYGAVDSEGNLVKLDTPEAVSKLRSGELKINYPAEVAEAQQTPTGGVVKFGRDSKGNIIPQ